VEALDAAVTSLTVKEGGENADVDEPDSTTGKAKELNKEVEAEDTEISKVKMLSVRRDDFQPSSVAFGRLISSFLR
jgi:hypothetical protein